MSIREKVIIRRASSYDPSLIKKLVVEGLEEFGLTPSLRGHVTIKPNVVMSHPKVAPSAFTRSEFLDGLLRAFEEKGDRNSRFVIAEKSGTGLPTTRMFRRSGYYRLKKNHRVKLLPIEEAKKKTVSLEKGVMHQKITTAREIVDKDFLVYTPKLKTNFLVQGLTAAVKLNIGILLDRERMWNHNFNLDHKIVDLLEVGYPDFIATDAIEISMGGNQFTQHGKQLGVVIMARNPLAHDVVCAHIFHLDPRSIRHLALASERGYGSLSLDAIEVAGDISLEEVRSRTKTWEVGFIRVDELDCGMKVRSGDPYCSGGCHGIFLDWLCMIKDRKPVLWRKLPEWTVVIGKYQGDVEAKRLLKIGTCTKILGMVNAKKTRKIRGCPPRHKDLVLWLLLKAGIVNPLFRVGLILDAYFFLFLSWMKRLVRGRF